MVIKWIGVRVLSYNHRSFDMIGIRLFLLWFLSVCVCFRVICALSGIFRRKTIIINATDVILTYSILYNTMQ